MELRHLETFHAACLHGSFVRAAEALQYPQSTITLQVHQLEQDLGVKLFDRSGRRLGPLLVSFSQGRPNARLSIEVSGTVSISERVSSAERYAGPCWPPSSR